MFDPMMGAELARAEELGLLDTQEGVLNRIAQVLAETVFPGPISEDDIEDACLECGVDPFSLDDEEIEWILSQAEALW